MIINADKSQKKRFAWAEVVQAIRHHETHSAIAKQLFSRNFSLENFHTKTEGLGCLAAAITSIEDKLEFSKGKNNAALRERLRNLRREVEDVIE